MNSIFYDAMDVYMVVYLYDLLLYSDSVGEHLRHLETILARLRDHHLYAGWPKCEIVTEETEFVR